MALDTYANLQTAIVALASRGYDTGIVVDAIKLGESRINADLGLDVTSVVTNKTMTPGSTTVVIDPTALIVRAMRYSQADGGDIIEASSPERWAEVKTDERGQPAYFLIRESTIEFNCPASQAYAVEIETFGRLAIASTSTNWLLTNLPQMYVYATMNELVALPERFGEEWTSREAQYKRVLGDARRLLNRIMARAEVRMSYDTPDSGEAYDITID